MAGMAQTGMDKILDTLTNKNAYALPTLYARLTTTTPTAAAAGTEITTGQYGGYAAQALTGASWSGASSGASTYNAAVDFGAASSSTGTTINGVEFWDAPTGGNRLWWEPLSITVSAGTHVSFASGQFVATVPILSAGVGFATTYANKFCDHMTGKTTFGSAPALFLALCTAACTATTLGTETTYTGYSSTRVQLATADVNVATTVGANVDVVSNTQKNFGPATSSATISNFGIMDNATVGSGALIAGGTISSGAVVSGVTPDLPSGSTIFRLN